ncbi:oxidoreductase-like protein [Dipodascopsis tothii]|uniref:oxidoreductase-like protein n=1 Tax=Dipodascopsis tothii TaxID=44089 RepID=UPI0034CF78D4
MGPAFAAGRAGAAGPATRTAARRAAATAATASAAARAGARSPADARAAARGLHTSVTSSSNPYKFYDLYTSQPARPKYAGHKEAPVRERVITPQEKARIVFGSRLAGPQRRKAVDAKARTIAGVRVPPRPIEPDNCCMSGCVNCVWELYREDVEEYQDRRRKAIEAIKANSRWDLWPADFGPRPKTVTEAPAEDDPWKGVDVSIRAFIETERRLKAQKKQGAAGERRAEPHEPSRTSRMTA